MKKYFRDVKKPRWYTLCLAAILFIWQCSAIIPAMRAFGGEYFIIIEAQLVLGAFDIMLYLIMQKDKNKKRVVFFSILSLMLGTATAIFLWEEPFNLLFGIFGLFGGMMLCISIAVVFYVLLFIIVSLFTKKRIEALYLAEPNMSFKEEYLDMMEEWESFGGRLNPGALKNKGNDYETWLSWIKEDKEVKDEDRVPQTLYFFIRNRDRKILGAISIRHRLNDDLLNSGGHIGYGIRPSERKKGYATKMLSHALKRTKEYGIKKVLITCDKDNIASEKVIVKNSGMFEDEITEQDGNILKRYWIDKTVNK